ncbi:MAG TPA: type II toxin-antitoxin system death-on-curing family toxin [Thermoanaerobaculia bacterium]|nr:type II toxin-antitoxin system death-on-curing family toxin [Thermoanaerobaculia bacterium]
MTGEPRWLLITVVVASQRALIAEHGGADGLRDRGLLESTLARPRNLLAYSDGDASLFDLAACYAYGLARNHCFVDGNKRIAFTAALTFLGLHGFRLNADREERVLTFLRLASGELSERELSEWLEQHCHEAP